MVGNYAAWFSDEIAIPEGSYKFKNLPGLVVALSSDDGDYQFGLISIKKNDREIEEIPALPLKNREEYLKKLKIVKKNPSFPMQQEDQASTMEQKDYINGKEVTQSKKI